MAFVISDGKLTGLDRPSTAAPSRVTLAADFSADYATIYKTQPHVRTVISFLARNIAQIGLHTFERISDVDRRRLHSADHPVAALLAKPNPTTTRYRWFDALVNDMGIYDVACWAKVRPAGQIAGLLRLPPSQISPLGNSWSWPEGVRFRGSKGHIDIPVDQVVLFHGYNPSDARWGLSPMETLRQILAEEYQATLYREQLWRNGARFPGHIRRPAGAKWSDEARERFRNDWRGLYTGAGPGAGGTPILEDGMTFEGGGITPVQAQYLETRKLTREEVASAFHIPLPMVGILDHATFSNIEEQHKNLYQDTLGPWLAMIEQEIGLQLVSELDDTGKVYVEFNLAEKMKGSFEEQAASLQTAVGAPWLTRNEARARQNLPQVPDGDALVTPLNVLIGGQASATDSAPKSNPWDLLPAGHPDASKQCSGCGTQWVDEETARGCERKHRGGGVHVKARAPQTYQTKHEQVLRAFFKRQGAVVRTALGVKAAGDWWDADRWDSELASDLYALAITTSEQVAKSTLDSLGASPDEYDVDRTLAFLAAVSKTRAANINATTKAQIDAALQADDVTQAVGNVFDVAENSRTAQIATVAVTASSAFGATEAGKQAAGDSATKTWVTGPNARASHAAMDGETVPLSENFSNGLAWPGDAGDADEVAGCNCSLDINIP